MRADLHSHTINSDGVLTEEGLLQRAKARGVDVLALTDHDSVFGCEEFYSKASLYGIKAIKGMELSTDYKGESVHIVCLFKENKIPDEMLQFSKDIKERRRNRAIKFMEGIRDIYGLKVDIEGLLGEGTIITRGNMLRNVMRCNNMSMEEAAFYVSFDSKAYIPSTKLSTEDGLRIAKDAGCFTIFAHPCLIKDKNNLAELLEFDFDAIEAKYANKKNDFEYFKSICESKGFLMSAGSDCHGDDTHADVGSVYLDEVEFLPVARALHLEEEIYGNKE